MSDIPRYRCPGCGNEDQFQIIKENLHCEWWYIWQGTGEESRPFSCNEVYADDVRCMICECEKDASCFIRVKDAPSRAGKGISSPTVASRA